MRWRDIAREEMGVGGASERRRGRFELADAWTVGRDRLRPSWDEEENALAETLSDCTKDQNIDIFRNYLLW
jgi:hypothetical protein